MFLLITFIYLEIYRTFPFLLFKDRRITIKKKSFPLLLFITLQFAFEKRPVLGLSRVTYPITYYLNFPYNSETKGLPNMRFKSLKEH